MSEERRTGGFIPPHSVKLLQRITLVIIADIHAI